MELIVYARENTDAGERLLAAIGSLLAKRNYTICRSIGALSGRLRKRFFHPETGVLLASSLEELQELLSIQDLLETLKFILILPDGNRDTVIKGRTLSPKFVGFCTGDFSGVAAVLERMITNLDRDLKALKGGAER